MVGTPVFIRNRQHATLRAVQNLTPPTPLKDAWREEAACLGLDFMTIRGRTDDARQVCKRCDVYVDCLRWVVQDEPIVAGVVAGLTPTQRGLRECPNCGTPQKAKKRTALCPQCSFEQREAKIQERAAS